ncbi:MAG: dTMP kinase [Thermomicrobiales bacterium]
MVAHWPLSRLDPGDPSSWARHSFPGLLVAIDGVDGSGRATQLDLLAAWLQVNGYGVVRSSWNSSKLVAKTIAESRRQNTLTPLTYSILHATDVAERQETEIIPALRAGYVVLADRYVYTAFARDIARGVERDWIYNLYGFAVRPDLPIYLRIDAETSMGRVMGIAGEATAEEAAEGASIRGAIESFRLFQERVVEEYDRLVEPFELLSVDASLPVRTQQLRLRALLGTLLERLGGV